MLRTLARRLVLPAAALAVVALPACDLYEPSLDDFQLVLQVDDVPVALGQGVSAPIRPDRPSASQASVPTDFDVAAVQELESITLRPDMVTFEAAGGGTPSGTITAVVFLEGDPVPGMPVVLTVTDGAVTDITPNVIASADSELDAEAIEALLARVPASERPALADWQSLTVDQIRDRIREALAHDAIDVAVAFEVASTDPTDPLLGTLTLDEIDVSATIER